MAEAAAEIQKNSDIYLIVICRQQGDLDGYDLAKQLEAAVGPLSIPVALINDEEGLQQALTSAHPRHAALLNAIFGQHSLGIAVGLSAEPADAYDSFFPIVNQAFLRITGRSRVDLTKLGWEKVLHPEDAVQGSVQQRLLEKGLISNYSMEQRLIKPDGSRL